jgi:succinate dehydrogenase hydrophobic anchor subunit
MQQSIHSNFTLRWFTQAGLGILLVLLLAVHLIVNHWVAPQGLLTYADVVRYYDLPGIVWMEATFLIVVTVHCLLGLYSILLDLNLSLSITRLLVRFLLLAGMVAIVYGVWLIKVINSLPAVGPN